MQRFAVGDRVLIRYGKRAGTKATVIKVRPDQDYKVRSEDGAVLFFTGAGLEVDGPPPSNSRQVEKK